MRVFISIIACVLFLTSPLLAQENENKEEVAPKKIDKPVRSPFGSGYLIDNLTTDVPIHKTLEFIIQHKFGVVENGTSDLFGIYAPGSNIRMALNYVPIENVQLGFGLTKKNMHSDFNIKWSVLKQTRKNTMPVSLTLYANLAIDGREKDVFGIDYKSTHRLSYFSQAIVSRKFTDWLSLQVAGSFTHYNSVDTISDHDKVGIHFSGRVKFSPQSSFIFNYDIPLDIESMYSSYGKEALKPKPNLALGVEIATSTHAFQIFIGTADGLLPQDVMMYNQNDYTEGEMALAFSITRLWNF